MKIFDVEEEKTYEEKLILRILSSLSEVTQLNFMCALYLCGINPSQSSYLTNSGSYLLKISPDVSCPTSSLLVSSIFSHSSPAMIGWMNEELLVIGGREQIECEYYVIKQAKWRQLPSLPEDRFRGTLLSDEINQYIYMFGGYCSIGKKNIKTVLRLNMAQTLVWEMMIIKENEGLLARNSSIAIQLESNTIYILGGKNDKGKSTDYIAEFNIINKSIKVSNRKLPKECSFDEQNGVELKKMHFNYFDDESNMIKISKIDMRITLFNYEDMQGRAYTKD